MTLITDAPIASAPAVTTPASPPHRRIVRTPAPVGARFPRRVAHAVIETTLVTRSELRPAHPVGARFPRLTAEQRQEVVLVEVPYHHSGHPAVGARFPR